jgi:hypothetical protein
MSVPSPGDTLLATEEPTDLAQIGCHSSGSPNNTAWWSYTPRRSGHLEIAGTDYVLARDTAAGTEVVYDPGDCTGGLARPHVSAGTRYLIEALTPQSGVLDVFGPVLVPGGPITVRVSQQVGPSALTGVTATTDRDARTATLRWSDPACDGDSPITGYRVRRNGDDTGGTGPGGQPSHPRCTTDLQVPASRCHLPAFRPRAERRRARPLGRPRCHHHGTRDQC